MINVQQQSASHRKTLLLFQFPTTAPTGRGQRNRRKPSESIQILSIVFHCSILTCKIALLSKSKGGVGNPQGSLFRQLVTPDLFLKANFWPFVELMQIIIFILSVESLFYKMIHVDGRIADTHLPSLSHAPLLLNKTSAPASGLHPLKKKGRTGRGSGEMAIQQSPLICGGLSSISNGGC